MLEQDRLVLYSGSDKYTTEYMYITRIVFPWFKFYVAVI